jgi:hypothetical protein
MVWNRLSQTKRSIGVLSGVQGQSHFMLGAVMLVPEVCFLFLEMRGIGEEDPQQIDGCRRSINGTTESLLYKARKVARVIDMRVGQNDRVQGFGVHRRFLPVPQAKLLHALEEPAVDEDSLPRRFK